MSRFGSRLLTLAVLVVLAMLVVACGSGGAAASPAGDGDAAAPEPAGSAARAAADEDLNGYSEGEDGGGPGGPDADPPLTAPIEQRIVKTGEITVEVPNVGEAIGRVRAMAASVNGYVGGSQAGTLEESATITLRIPADRFEDVIAQLHELDGEVQAEATREQDVTSQVVDLQARIDNLRASEASYRELAARAQRVEDVLAVQSRLDEVRGQIEQLTAQLAQVEGQAALSTLTVTLVPRAEPVQTTAEEWDPGAELQQAVASLVGVGQGLLNGLIWFGIVWLPILLVLALLVLIVLRGVLEVRRRMPPAGSAAGSAGDGGGV